MRIIFTYVRSRNLRCAHYTGNAHIAWGTFFFFNVDLTKSPVHITRVNTLFDNWQCIMSAIYQLTGYQQNLLSVHRHCCQSIIQFIILWMYLTMFKSFSFVKIAGYIREKMEINPLNVDPFPDLVIAIRNFELKTKCDDDEYLENEFDRYCVKDLIQKKILTKKDILTEPVQIDEDKSDCEEDEDEPDAIKEEVILKSKDAEYVKTLKDYFKTRKCFLFPTPTVFSDEGGISHTYSNDHKKLRDDFKNKVAAFGDYICIDAKPKLLDRNPVDGDLFIQCLTRYIDFLEKSSELGFHDIAKEIIKNNNDKFIQETTRAFQSAICNIFKTLPLRKAELEEGAACINTALNFYMKNGFVHHGDNDHYNRLKEQMCQVFPEYVDNCSKESEERLESLFKEKNGDLNQVKADYERSQSESLMKVIALNEFLFGKANDIPKMKITDYTRYRPTEILQMKQQVENLTLAIGDCIRKSLVVKAVNEKQARKKEVQNEYDIEIKKRLKRIKRLKKIGNKKIEIQLLRMEIAQLKNKRDQLINQIWLLIKSFPHVALLKIGWMFEKLKNFIENSKTLDYTCKIEMTQYVYYE